MKTNRRESAVKAAVHAYLMTRTDIFWWRQNNGLAFFGDFPVKMSLDGVGDFIGMQALPISWLAGAGSTHQGVDPLVGRFFAVECKREKGGTQNDDQKRFQRNVEMHGGLYLLVRSVEEVSQGLGLAMVHLVKERKKRVIAR